MLVGTLKKAIAIGLICSSIAVPVVADVNTTQIPSDFNTISARGVHMEKQKEHWAQANVEKLSTLVDLNKVINYKSLDDVISRREIEKLINATIDSEYKQFLETITREEVVTVLVDIWARKTDQRVEDIMIPLIAVYEDTAKINNIYLHNVMLAHFNGFVKGKAPNVFAPKDRVTYGEAITLVSRIYNAIAKWEKEQSTPGVASGNFEVRGSYEVKDAEVIFDFELFSHFTEKKEVGFSSGQQFELTIVNEEGVEVYRYSDDRFFTMALLFKEIGPGESLTWQDSWNRKDKAGKEVEGGKFKAIIEIKMMNSQDLSVEEADLRTEIEFEL